MTGPAAGTVEFRLSDGTLRARLLLKDRMVPRADETAQIDGQPYVVSGVVWHVNSGDGPDAEMSILQSITVDIR